MKAIRIPKPRLTLLCHLPPPVHGAAVMGKMVVESSLLREQYDCTVIPIQIGRGLEDLRRFSLTKIVGSLGLFLRLFKSLLVNRPAAVYMTVSINGFAAVRDLGLVLLCRVMRVQRIFHLHTKGVRPRYDNSVFFRVLYRVMFNGAQVIHLAQRLYSDVEPVVRPENFHVVANGVPDPLMLRPDRAQRIGDSAGVNSPTILFMSNLYTEKGPLDLLKASKKLSAQGMAHRVIFVGAAADSRVNEILARAAADDSCIELHGGAYGAEKELLLRSAQIFVFPSYYRFECQPLAVIEAMSHGLAVIASNNAGIPDLIRDGRDGFLIPMRDVDAMVSAVRRLLLDSVLCERLGRSARARYEACFTSQAFERRLVTTVAKIINRNGRSPECDRYSKETH